ncbi:MAG TPA: DUF4194 domain-containing protein [Ktedonobacteraceae bacterium]|nr:DUF4194 domain-containing protein [Ktedonobacteraceae bacterium]
MRNNQIAPFAPAVIRLLQGPLYSDDATPWKILVQYYDQVRLYCGQIGLELQLHEEDGYAYLRQPEWEDDEGHAIELPRLTRRQPLSRDVSMLCVLLREQLLLFETGSVGGSACLLSREQIRELLLPALPERNNELLLQKRIDSLIERVAELGFLKKVTRLGQDYFELRRILKAKINADQLVELKERLLKHGVVGQ